MLCLFYFAIITDKMCLFRFLDLKGRRTTYIILNIGLHYWKSCSRFNSCALSSAYLFICLFISNVDQKLSRNRRCQRHSDLFQWFITTNVRNLSLVSSTHHVFNMNLSSFNIESLIHSCLPAWGAHIIKCMLSHSHLPAVIITLLNPPFDAQRDWAIWTPPLHLNHHFLIILNNNKGRENHYPFHSKPWYTHTFQTICFLRCSILVQPVFINESTVK